MVLLHTHAHVNWFDFSPIAMTQLYVSMKLMASSFDFCKLFGRF